ncbi:MAG TPA: LysR family transcriptional regulator [Clostridia bacterium]|nr:LysR family transcriptional regulator [Clostridia bacterium]
MDIKQLRYFVEIVKVGGYSEAAKKLYVSQPNLSKSIKNLEQELGQKLFYMEGNRARLTESGENLFRMSQSLIEQYDEVYNVMRNMTHLITGTVKVGIPPIIGTCVIPKLLAGFKQKYPDIHVQVNQKAADTVQRLVDEKKLDIGFTIMPVISDAFQIIPLVKDKNMLIVHKDHPMARYKKVNYEMLKNETFILLDDEYTLYGNIVAGCRESGFEPRILLKASQWDFVVQLVKINMGISIIPRRILEMYPMSDIVEIDIDHRSSAWDVAMITKQNTYKSAATKQMISFIEEYSQNLIDSSPRAGL